jgi:hypothetical protein
VKDHYLNYPCVLVRLARIHDDALRDLLRMGYEFVRRRNKRSPSKAGHPVRSRKAPSRKRSGGRS